MEVFHTHKDGIIFERNSTIFKYLDQLSKEISYIDKMNFCNYLLNKYQLTRIQYYNIVVHSNIDYHPLCVCNKPLKFVNLVIGYRSFCSKSCNSINTQSKPDFKKSLKDRMSIAFIEMNKNQNYQNQQKHKTFISKSKRLKSQDNCVFYISESNTYFKFGISVSMSYAKLRTYRAGGLINRYFISTNIHVANLELDVKTKFNHHNEKLNTCHLDEILLIVNNNENFVELYEK